jgi:TusA-related sulfurtransferase
LADSRGRACPLPIVDLARALRSSPLVELWADDPAAHGDLVAFCEATGHELVSLDASRPLRAVIRRAPVPGSGTPRR